ncbi:MAG: UPF0149 family protein [Proteobacteria bacterium]|nr:UPF0149 family protein [Pseudomonadota bacterium]
MSQALVVPEFEALNQALMEAALTTAASEAQGLICGVLCAASSEEAGASWVPVLLSEQADGTEGSDAIKQVTRMLVAIHQQLLGCLKEKDFALRLMLPDEEQPVARRLEALADWCSGFLMGLVAGGAGDISKLPAESAEIARDIMKIAEVVSEEESGEEEEESLMQLEEYVRLGALAIYDELHPQKQVEGSGKKTPSVPAGETRH